MVMRNIRVLLLTSLVGLAVLAPSAHAKVVIGISDNKPSMFADQRFKDLKVSWARNVLPWDGLRYADDRARTDEWMAGAKADKIKVLVTFDRSRHGIKSPRVFFLGQYRKQTPPKRSFHRCRGLVDLAY